MKQSWFRYLCCCKICLECNGQFPLHYPFVIILKPEAEREKEKQAAQEELKKALQEKEQALMDLNSMERSFADLFKRLEKHKEVIEGYKKVAQEAHS